MIKILDFINKNADFGIYPLKEEDFFESDVELEYLHAMDNWLLFDVEF